MKIIHFITSIDKTAGGTTAYLKLLSQELKNTVELLIVTGNSQNPVIIEDVNVLFVDLSLIRLISIEKKFRVLLILEQPNIVHIEGIWDPPCWLFQKVAQDLGIKVVLSPHGMLESYIMNRHPLKKKLAMALYQHKALQQADFLHATAQSELDQIRKLGYHQSAQIIPNGIDVKDIKQKVEWGRVRNILFLSRVHPKKGLEVLIDAVTKLTSYQFIISIAGEGDTIYIESLKKLTVQKGVSEYFDFVGGIYDDQKWELYHNSDLFILPTYSENFGIVVAEALSTGLPVITTTGTPWKELETNNCGWWVDLMVDNLIQALREALNCDADKLKTMGLNGRKLVAEKYEISTIALQMSQFYKKINN